MDGDESFDVSMGLHEVHNGLDLRLRVSPGSTVGLRAWAAAGTRAYMVKGKTAIHWMLLSFSTCGILPLGY